MAASQYIYLLQEREFIKTGEPVYKIGRSVQENLARFRSYPKGSVLHLQVICADCVACEREILAVFRQNFLPRTDVGAEYFEGNPAEMRDAIYTIVSGERMTTSVRVDSVFPNFTEDFAFGGVKSLVFFTETPPLMLRICNYQQVERVSLADVFGESVSKFYRLIHNGVISFGTVYDIKSPGFIAHLSRNKRKIFGDTEEFCEEPTDWRGEIRRVFL